MRNRLDFTPSVRVVKHGNHLSQHVIEAPSLNAFMNRFEKFSDTGN